MHGTHGPHLPSALRPRAETAEEQQAPQQLETVVQVRPGVEAVQLGEICASDAYNEVSALLVWPMLLPRTFMLHHEAPAGRPILGAAVLEGSIEVERLGAHVEHEEERRACDTQLAELNAG